MTDKALVTQYKSLLVQAANILLSAENSITAAYEQAKTPNEVAGTIIDVPEQLKQVSTLIETVLILNRHGKQEYNKGKEI